MPLPSPMLYIAIRYHNCHPRSYILGPKASRICKDDTYTSVKSIIGQSLTDASENSDFAKTIYSPRKCVLGGCIAGLVMIAWIIYDDNDCALHQVIPDGLVAMSLSHTLSIYITITDRSQFPLVNGKARETRYVRKSTNSQAWVNKILGSDSPSRSSLCFRFCL